MQIYHRALLKFITLKDCDKVGKIDLVRYTIMEDMREKIVDVATDLFMKNGFHGTSTRHIAKILNISQPAIYHHFPNKEYLYLEVLRKFALEVGRSLNIQLYRSVDDESKLLEMSKHLKDNHPVNLSLMMHDMNNELSEDAKREVFAIWMKNYIYPLQEFFAEVIQKNNLTHDPNLISRLYMRGLSPFINDDFSNFYNSDLELKLFVDIFMRGLKSKSTQ